MGLRIIRAAFALARFIGTFTLPAAAFSVSSSNGEGTSWNGWKVGDDVADSNGNLKSYASISVAPSADAASQAETRPPIPGSFELDELSTAQRFELEERWKATAEVVEVLVPALADDDSYNGLALDRESGNIVIFMDTEDVVDTRAVGLSAYAIGRLEYRVSSWGQNDLDAALEALVSRWTASKIGFVSAGSDLVGQQLVITVTDESYREAVEDLELNPPAVPYSLEAAEVEQDQACTSRTDCSSPMKAGTVIRKGNATTGPRCTMGFHVQIGTDEQFLTAGHCGWSGSNSWYHPGYGLVGSETATLYTTSPPAQSFDVMRVQMSDTQDSNLTYGSGSKNQYRLPIQNESVCISRGVSGGTNPCGTVSLTWTAWVSSECNCTQWGADANGYTTKVGDSGSPIYAGSYAVGIHNNSSQRFARVSDAMASWGIGIRQ